MDPHTGPRLVTLSARCTPPWHQQLINLVTWVYIWRDGRGARVGGARHAHPHTPCPDILLHYTETVDCECCSDEDIQGQNIGIKCLPIQLCYTLNSAVQRVRDILFLCTRWSASASHISHTRPSTALVLSSSSWSGIMRPAMKMKQMVRRQDTQTQSPGVYYSR